ncbi:hypothetical protein RD792_015217 [Penstemon davidsonii]|uniref:Protein arginine N-methyltransferase domain-containing protein n=1 Tax=Penstemon davidsonii TaxID=160366 RepID=A0ABR0CRF1_9LAMI|nr:hypothetical protein RD792_015217 [Penstemon davidsonii]
MYQPTSSGNGGASQSNGYHLQGEGHVTGRRGSRGRSRDYSSRVFQQQDKERPPAPCTDFDSAYFHSYAHLGIHEEMIKDRARTETYRNAIFQHQDRIAGKVVVDVGCGTGILSIFCAQAGAKRVYAVDASDIAIQANEVVKANNLSDTIIVLHGRVEDVEIDDKVDVIVSEWMGYMLLYELYMAPVSHPDRYSDSVDFWRNVYGIDMSAMMPLAKQCAFEEPSVETISGENVLTWPHVVKHVDCYNITVHELESVSTRFKFKSMMRAPFNGFAFWFDVEFGGVPATYPSNNDAPPEFVETVDNHVADTSQRKKRPNPNEALVLSTAPEDPATHWQQTLIYLYDPLEVEQDQLIEGSVKLSQSKENPRFMNIHLEYESGGRSFVKESVMR